MFVKLFNFYNELKLVYRCSDIMRNIYVLRCSNINLECVGNHRNLQELRIKSLSGIRLSTTLAALKQLSSLKHLVSILLCEIHFTSECHSAAITASYSLFEGPILNFSCMTGYLIEFFLSSWFFQLYARKVCYNRPWFLSTNLLYMTCISVVSILYCHLNVNVIIKLYVICKQEQFSVEFSVYITLHMCRVMWLKLKLFHHHI